MLRSNTRRRVQCRLKVWHAISPEAFRPADTTTMTSTVEMRVFSKYSDPIQAAPSSHSIHTTTGWPAGYLAHYINQTCSVMESTYDLSTNDQHNQCVESILCKLSVKLCSRRFDLFRLAPLLTNSQFLSPDLNLNGTTICCCSAIASRRVLFISRPILPEG